MAPQSKNAYPLVLSLALPPAAARTARYAIERLECYRSIDRIDAAAIAGPPAYLADASMDQVAESLAWNVPTVAIATPELGAPELQLLRNMGLAALWKIDQEQQGMVFPELALAWPQSQAILVEDDPSLRQMFRQILRFAGYDARSDFRNAAEIIQALESDLQQNSTRSELAVLNLDSERCLAAEFFDRLRALYQRYSQLRSRLRLVLMKDFSRPGLDLRMIQRLVQPYARRIFHPEEAALALLEGFFFYEAAGPQSRSQAQGNRQPASLDQLLFGSGIEPLREWPAAGNLSGAMQAEGRRVLFRWLPALLAGDASRSAALADSPGRR